MPPKWRRIEPSTWLKRWNRRSSLLAPGYRCRCRDGKATISQRAPAAMVEADRNLAVARELDSSVEKVEQGLAQPGLVADQRRRKPRVDREADQEGLPLGDRGDDRGRLAEPAPPARRVPAPGRSVPPRCARNRARRRRPSGGRSRRTGSARPSGAGRRRALPRPSKGPHSRECRSRAFGSRG